MTAHPPRRSHALVDAAALFLLTLGCAMYAFPRWADWNQNSRFDLTVAIVDHGTLSIDCCVSNTGDYAVFEGRTYSDKAPGLSFLAIPPYLLWKAVATFGVGAATQRIAQGTALHRTLRPEGTGLLPEKVAFAGGLTLATLLVVTVPAALANVVLFSFLAAFNQRRLDRIAVTLTYALATIAFPYAGAFYAHQLVAALLLTAFAILHALPRVGTPQLRLAGSGFLLGYAVISEYPAVLIVAVLLGYAMYQARRRALPRLAAAGWLAIGLAPPLALAAAYHWAIFKTPWPVAYRYSALWQERHAVGLISVSIPRLDALWGITFSPFRGVFFLSPVLLLSVWGLWRLWRREPRAEAWVSILAVGSFLAFNSGSVMWWGGFAIGPRYLVPMLPFLAWPLIVFLGQYGPPRWGRVVYVALAVASLVMVWSLTFAGQHFPEDSYRFPSRDYALPQLVQGNVARNAGMLLGLSGWYSLAPLWLASGVLGGSWWALTRR